MESREQFIVKLTKLYLSIYLMKKNSLRYRLVNPQDAEDILQEAYTRALEYWTIAPVNEEELAPWFNLILKQSVAFFINFYKYRGTSSNNRSKLDYITVKFVDFKEQHGGVSEDEGEMYIYKSFLYDMLLEESPKHRPILVCNLIHGLDPEEIVKITMFSKDNVKKILYRFRKKLKETYDEKPTV